MPRRIDPTAHVRVPRHAPNPVMLLAPARCDGTRIRLDLYGPVHRTSGTYYWIGWTLENPDGTTRHAWARQYSGANARRVRADFASQEQDLRADRLTLPAH